MYGMCPYVPTTNADFLNPCSPWNTMFNSMTINPYSGMGGMYPGMGMYRDPAATAIMGVSAGINGLVGLGTLGLLGYGMYKMMNMGNQPQKNQVINLDSGKGAPSVPVAKLQTAAPGKSAYTNGKDTATLSTGTQAADKKPWYSRLNPFGKKDTSPPTSTTTTTTGPDKQKSSVQAQQTRPDKTTTKPKDRPTTEPEATSSKEKTMDAGDTKGKDTTQTTDQTIPQKPKSTKKESSNVTQSGSQQGNTAAGLDVVQDDHEGSSSTVTTTGRKLNVTSKAA